MLLSVSLPLLLHLQDIQFFQHLEMYMRQEHATLCGRDHLHYRSYYIPVKVCVCVHACVRGYVRACVGACVRACVRALVSVLFSVPVVCGWIRMGCLCMYTSIHVICVCSLCISDSLSHICSGCLQLNYVDV